MRSGRPLHHFASDAILRVPCAIAEAGAWRRRSAADRAHAARRRRGLAACSPTWRPARRSWPSNSVGPNPGVDDWARRLFEATGDQRSVVSDPHALYFGTGLEAASSHPATAPASGDDFDTWLSSRLDP